jgi:type II secretory pathway component PulM
MTLLAAAPALPLHEAGKYVAGAYVVFVVLILVYVAIMAAKLQRIEKDLGELASFAEQRADANRDAPDTNPGSPGSGAEEVPGIGSAEEVAGNV